MSTHRRVTPRDVLDFVVPPELADDFYGRSRRYEAIHLRAVCAVACRALGHTYTDISEAMGRRSHSSARWYYNRSDSYERAEAAVFAQYFRAEYGPQPRRYFHGRVSPA